MGDRRPVGIISGSLDLQPEGAGGGAGRGDDEAQAGLAADGVVELAVEVELVSGAAQEPAGTATKGQLVAVPAQAGRAQADYPVEWRRQRLDGCALPPGRYVPGEHEALPSLPGRKRVFANGAQR